MLKEKKGKTQMGNSEEQILKATIAVKFCAQQKTFLQKTSLNNFK